MNRVFHYHDYKRFVIERLEALPSGGRGEFQKISKRCGMHPTLVSQIFKGPRDLSLEQAYDIAAYLDLNELETDYFIRLVQYSRCGTERARNFLRSQIEKTRAEASRVENRVHAKRILSDEERAIFYSTWAYSAVRNATSLPQFSSVEAIATRLKLSRTLVDQIVQFLLERGLCKMEDGKLLVGPQSTHIPSTSPLVTRHHANWRQKGLEKMDRMDRERELFFTAPMSLSEDDVVWFREQILELIEKLTKRVKETKPETLACLNLDWFTF
ncbi:MAG: TIGR02147 family protein [Oligoflexia bacterium]|nr:TIGR02147 family protein [Oligoflexia bacterium]